MSDDHTVRTEVKKIISLVNAIVYGDFGIIDSTGNKKDLLEYGDFIGFTSGIFAR